VELEARLDRDTHIAVGARVWPLTGFSLTGERSERAIAVSARGAVVFGVSDSCPYCLAELDAHRTLAEQAVSGGLEVFWVLRDTLSLAREGRVNSNFINATLGQIFEFNRNPRLPVFSNWVVDFNAFFDTGVSVPVNNKARKIDSFIANGLETLPGFSGVMQILATRNLRRGLALGLPSGQGMAASFGLVPMTASQLTTGLPAAEIAVLNSNSGLLMKKTPLWYYVLREAAVIGGGSQLGPVGARIVAETFVRILKRDAPSYLNAGGFAPILPSATPGNFTVADLVTFAGVSQP